MDLPSVCDICLQYLDDESTTIVHEKGLNTLIKKSKLKNDDKWRKWTGKKTYPLHKHCRKRYAVSSSKSTINSSGESHITSSSASNETATTSQSTEFLVPPSPSFSECSSSSSQFPTSTAKPASDFQFEKLCFICGKKWNNKPGFLISQNNIKDRLIARARECEDEFGAPIIARLQNIESIVTKKARYHKVCYNKLMSPISKKPRLTKDIAVIFEKICNYIETSNEFKFKLSTLKALMGNNEDNRIETRTLLRRLKKKYGNDILIFQHVGKDPLIYYKFYDIIKICGDWFNGGENLSESAKRTIVNVSAEIIKDEIIKKKYDTDIYPKPQDFLHTVTSDIPSLLNTFLHKLLFTEKKEQSDETSLDVKIENIAHSITTILRPKSFMSCLQLSIGTYIYRKTGSRLVINLLNKLGVCSSYHSIQLHEASTIVNPQETIINDAFVQYIFDNTDHNVNTLDGHETFHCLGGIAVYTPGSNVIYEGTTKRCKKMPNAETLASKTPIDDKTYDSKRPSGLAEIEYQETSKLKLGIRHIISPTYASFLWGKCFQIDGLPMWRGYMETISSKRVDYVVSHIKCLPFINRPRSNYGTLYTALRYAAEETSKLNQITTFVTFDQPLYLKARNIVAQYEDAEFKNVVVRLGGFHLLMSYLGAIGSIMAESGLEKLWSVSYASESVKRMLSGHAFSKAVRAHILTFAALGIIICRSICKYNEFREVMESFFAEWTEDPPSIDDCESNQNIQILNKLFTMKLVHIANYGPTAKLWIQYFRSVLVALEFIEAERLGNWKLHLQCIEKMLPVFHAAGHYPYAKCAQLYLQDMAHLEARMEPTEYDNFTTKGFFTVRRSHKAWPGIWSDMTIEQTLNRYFGTDLKHGRGVTPSVVARYLSTMPSAFVIMSNLEEYCGIMTSTSEQHVDLTQGRLKRDEIDLHKFLHWLDEHKPFIPRDHLISLSTGIVGGPNIDCYLAFEKGEKGMRTMYNVTVEKVTLSQMYKVKTFAVASKGTTINHKEFTSIQPLMLFQRIAKYLTSNTDLIRSALEYELSPFSLSLFDDDGYMRKATKADLFSVFDNFIGADVIVNDSSCVIDGEWLLHEVDWPKNCTFGGICELYLSFIQDNYPESCVIFNGYIMESVAVKTYEIFRRRLRNVAPDIDIKMNLLATLTRDKFLVNVANKQRFIQLLAGHLQQSNVPVKIVRGNADRSIITTAIELNARLNKSIVVVSNNVDLLVLLIAFTPENETMYFYKVGPGKQANEIYATLNNRKFKKFILFAHAFCGCNTTSALYNKGKKKNCTTFLEDLSLIEMIAPFYNHNSDQQTLYNIAEKIIFKLYLNFCVKNSSIFRCKI